LLLRNSTTGGLEVYDINNNRLTNAAFIGTVGLDWQFAGIAPVHGAGESDLVVRNKNTGQFEVYPLPVPKKIGIRLVAALASIAAAVLCGATITATRRRTRSAANSGRRSLLFCAQRNSIATLRPSTNPVSPKPLRNADTRCATGSGEPASMYPTTGIATCCALAASGYAAAAPPSSVMNSRRFIVTIIQSPRRRGRATSAEFQGPAPWRWLS